MILDAADVFLIGIKGARYDFGIMLNKETLTLDPTNDLVAPTSRTKQGK
ncbi:hypothetical protein QN219_14210 [Sinorhizobium sp. 7-81]|nr:hypothetical protein [Sinorhizobium sp. 8-89]MDK1491208.1 hypothetical protein [Sinorhizobium sp. 8-89]